MPMSMALRLVAARWPALLDSWPVRSRWRGSRHDAAAPPQACRSPAHPIHPARCAEPCQSGGAGPGLS